MYVGYAAKTMTFRRFIGTMGLHRLGRIAFTARLLSAAFTSNLLGAFIQQLDTDVTERAKQMTYRNPIKSALNK